MKQIALTLAFVLLAGAALGAGAGVRMWRVGPGLWTPLFPPSDDEKEIPVAAFSLDETQVTEAEFGAFVRSHPEWRRDRVPALFADERYLHHWSSPTDPPSSGDRPVVSVSWWAAKAYCEAAGKRLPLEAEWELAASASATSYDASGDPAFVAQILRWYGEAPRALPSVRDAAANKWGVRGMHGVVWEWVLDFQSALILPDNRNQDDPDKVAFCGGGALDAEAREDYATFMRLAFRSSLEGRSTTNRLGFRCARSLDLPEER